MAIEKKISCKRLSADSIRDSIRTEISDCRSLLFDPPCRNPAKSVPCGKAIWNANGGFVSVLLTHLFVLWTNKFFLVFSCRNILLTFFFNLGLQFIRTWLCVYVSMYVCVIICLCIGKIGQNLKIGQFWLPVAPQPYVVQKSRPDL